MATMRILRSGLLSASDVPCGTRNSDRRHTHTHTHTDTHTRTRARARTNTHTGTLLAKQASTGLKTRARCHIWLLYHKKI